MDKGVYLAATSIRADNLRQQNQAHEMSNIATIGFKKAFQINQVTYRVDSGNALSSRFYKVAEGIAWARKTAKGDAAAQAYQKQGRRVADDISERGPQA